MVNSTAPFDWVEDVCYIKEMMAASYENKIYSVGGVVSFKGIPDSDEVTDSYLRIVDFSEPVDSGTDSIDISTDKITIAIRLPDNIPRLYGGVLWISDGVLYMLPGDYEYYWNTADEYGNMINMTVMTTFPDLTNKVWSFDLESQKWDVHVSGVEINSMHPATGFDTKTQVGWYYGGSLFNTETVTSTGLLDLYRLERGKETPIKVETDSSLVGGVEKGQLIYIEGPGEAGILVLLQTWTTSFQTVHVWDIATKTWFVQSTTAEAWNYPPDSHVARFCSVVASAEDNSSHNIYLYVGDFGGGIFILTLPAFHWVYVGNPEDPEQPIDSQCLKVHEKHMVVYRGYPGKDKCDNDESLKKYQGIAIYDMTSLIWTTKVGLKNQKYLVPEVLHPIIGGNSTGHSTITEPIQGFQHPKLAQIFASPATSSTRTPATTKPATMTPATMTPATTLPPNNYSHSSLPLEAIAGGIAGAFVVVLLITVFFILRRRRRRTQPMPELAPTPHNPQELQSCEIHELPQPATELPSALIPT